VKLSTFLTQQFSVLKTPGAIARKVAALERHALRAAAASAGRCSRQDFTGNLPVGIEQLENIHCLQDDLIVR
jgi:hypothetical protein